MKVEGKEFKMNIENYIQANIDTLNEKIRTNEEISDFCKDCLKSRFSTKDNKQKAKEILFSCEARLKNYREELEGCYYLMNADL